MSELIIHGTCRYNKNELIIDILDSKLSIDIHIQLPIQSTLHDLYPAFHKVGHHINGFTTLGESKLIKVCHPLQKVYQGENYLMFGLDGVVVVELWVEPYKFGILDTLQSLNNPPIYSLDLIPFMTFAQLIRFIGSTGEHEEMVNLFRFDEAYRFLHYWTLYLSKVGMEPEDIKRITDIATGKEELTFDMYEADIKLLILGANYCRKILEQGLVPKYNLIIVL